MASEEPPTVPSALHVNEATLELLERRIEARVKAGFFKSVGAPVGLAGVAAIVYTHHSGSPVIADPDDGYPHPLSIMRARQDALHARPRGGLIERRPSWSRSAPPG